MLGKRVVMGALGALVGLAGAGLALFLLLWPRQRPAPDVRAEGTPEQLARGRYLVESVAACLHCHSEGAPELWATPPLPGREGAGGRCFGAEEGFPGRVCSTNLTAHPETGLGAWSDGEVLRALREGVGRDGRALAPPMPSEAYRGLSDADALAVVAYLRTLPAVPRQVPPRALPLPVELGLRLQPAPLEGPVPGPPAGDAMDAVARGRQLAEVAGCAGCHTPVDARHRPLPGRAWAGGRAFRMAGGAVVVSPNLTPHPTGLGGMDRATFVGLFRKWTGASRLRVPPAQNTPMPWLAYAGMRVEDLGALYDFLRTVPAVEQRVRIRPGAPRAAAD